MMKSLRIVTYNFLTGGSKQRNSHWSLLRAHLQSDILLAQECRPQPAGELPRIAALWEEAVGGRWGTGLFTTEAGIRPIEVPGFTGWVVGGELDPGLWVTGRPLRVFSVHCPPGKRGYVRTAHELLDRLTDVARGADLILGGDFNVAVGFRGPDEPVKMSSAERELLNRFVGEFDLIPCWQTANPGEPLAQTLRWTGNRAAPYHCDGIFVPHTWRERLRSCDVITGPEWTALSDHNPVIATFDRR